MNLAKLKRFALKRTKAAKEAGAKVGKASSAMPASDCSQTGESTDPCVNTKLRKEPPVSRHESPKLGEVLATLPFSGMALPSIRAEPLPWDGLPSLVLPK